MEKKQQKLTQIAEYLQAHPGYYKAGKLKVSYNKLIDKLNTDIVSIKEAINEIKKGSIDPRPTAPKLSQLNRLEITTPGTYLVTGCVHAPWHNQKMYNSIFNYIVKEEIPLSGVILDGDIVDLHSLSRHDKGKVPLPGVTLDWEYQEANKFLNQIDDLMTGLYINKNPRKIYIFGNHEDRYNRAIYDVDVSKYGSALKSPSEGLKLADRGYEVLEDWKSGHVKIGRYLEVNHGEFVNVHTAKKTIDTYRKSVLYFHTHRFQIYTEGLVGGWNMGWGGDVTAPVFDYATRAMKNSWMNGAALVTLDSHGYYHVQPLLYLNGKLIINGKQY